MGEESTGRRSPLSFSLPRGVATTSVFFFFFFAQIQVAYVVNEG